MRREFPWYPARHSGVIVALKHREIACRFRGSLLGNAWRVHLYRGLRSDFADVI